MEESTGHRPRSLAAAGGRAGGRQDDPAPHLPRAADVLVLMDMYELLEDGALLGIPIAQPASTAPVSERRGGNTALE